MNKSVLAFHQNLLRAEPAGEIEVLGRDPTGSDAFGSGCEFLLYTPGSSRQFGSGNDPVAPLATGPTFSNGASTHWEVYFPPTQTDRLIERLKIRCLLQPGPGR